MFQELSDVLQNTVNPAIYSGMTALTQALDKHHAVVYKDHVVYLKMNANNREPITLADDAISIVYDQVTALLQQMKIKIDFDTVSMDKLAAIIECLIFDPSDNDSEYLAVLDAGEDNVEILQEILAIYLQCDPVELMDCIHSVSSDTVRAIRDAVEKNLSYRENVQEGVQATVQLLNHYQTQVGEKLTVGLESLQQGLEVGGDMESMVHQARDTLLDMSPEDLGDNLISIAILAKTPNDALSDEVMHFAEGIVHDPFVVQKVYKRVSKRLSELSKEDSV